MEKVIKDGMVAVLYSRGFGAGWYSWNTEHVDCLFYPQIANLVIANGDEDLDEHVVSRIEAIATERWSGFYAGGAVGLTIKWISEGDQFEVNEYDGRESISIIGKSEHLIA